MFGFGRAQLVIIILLLGIIEGAITVPSFPASPVEDTLTYEALEYRSFGSLFTDIGLISFLFIGIGNHEIGCHSIQSPHLGRIVRPATTPDDARNTSAASCAAPCDSAIGRCSII